MLSIRKTLATASISALALSCLPAKALQVTGQIQNAPQTLSTSNTALQFPTFTAANFPAAFSGLAPNEYLQLTNIRISTKGKAQGTFTVYNSDTINTPSVPSGVFNYSIISNNVPSVLQTPSNQTGLTNTTGTVPVQTNTGGNTSAPPTCTPPATNGQTFFPGFGTIYFCANPGQATFTLNQPATTSSSISWNIAPSTGQTNPIASSFWTSGSSLNLNSQISFTPTSALTTSPLSLGPTTLSFLLSSLSDDTYLTYDYDKLVNTGVPAPLPLLGAGIGFGFSRRLRRRIKSASTLAS